jgi:2-hydroxy-3-keto-5-methylthiopentenyl-1-phosphate phosphatase
MNTSVRFVIDFDETLTSSDTTSLIASLNSITMPQWKAFEKNYLDAFTKHSDLALSRALTTKSMHVYFNDMAEFESKAIKETINGLYLRNISTQQLRELARNIVPKEDMQAALNRLVDISGANPVHVLSLSWSKTVIKEFLSIHFPNKISNFVVHANELEVDSTGISTGNIIGGIHIAQDKANQVRQIRTETDVGDGSAKLVCIGDSLNDLLALLSADYGIILGQFSESSKLAQLCSIDHIRLAPITELRPVANIGKNKSIFVAENWTQVISALDKQH